MITDDSAVTIDSAEAFLFDGRFAPPRPLGRGNGNPMMHSIRGPSPHMRERPGGSGVKAREKLLRLVLSVLVHDFAGSGIEQDFLVTDLIFFLREIEHVLDASSERVCVALAETT